MTHFKGSITALVTPFKDGAVDEAAFRAFINWQIEEGTNGLVPVGTTGESPTLSHKEHDRVVEICVDEARSRVPVIAGAGSNSTAEADARRTATAHDLAVPEQVAACNAADARVSLSANGAPGRNRTSTDANRLRRARSALLR